ncbi:MAG: 1,4-alpha-glucan branching protein GlgB [Baekduia sp.]
MHLSDDTYAAFLNGTARDLAETLGAFPAPGGTRFAVWAPHATSVTVVLGDEASHPLRIPTTPVRESGVWSVDGVDAPAGTRYRFAITGADGETRLKADPMAREAAPRPSDCSVVTVPAHRWSDDRWLAARARSDPRREPLSVYEVHLGTWRWDPREPGRERPYTELAPMLADHAERLGVTHVELMPIAAHPFPGSWGYQGTGYFAPDPRHGSSDELKALIDHLHGRGIGVIADWVPGHFSADEYALGRFDGEPLYEHPDPRRGTQPAFGALVFNLQRPEVRSFLLSCAAYWLEEFHIDGLRVDAVSSMLRHDWGRPGAEVLPEADGSLVNPDAISFLRELNELVEQEAPGAFTVAEEATAWPGVTHDDGLGFTFCWNMGWSHDWLAYLELDPAERPAAHNEITFASAYAGSEHFVLALSHDVIAERSLTARMWGSAEQRLAGQRALLALQWAHRGKKLLFMGAELAAPSAWTHDWALDWTLPERDRRSAGMLDFVSALGHAYRARPALWAADDVDAGFEWVEADDAARSVYAWIRCAPGAEPLLCVANLGAEPQAAYRIDAPRDTQWRIVLDSDEARFGGAGTAAARHDDGVLVLDLPPFACLWLVPEGDDV